AGGKRGTCVGNLLTAAQGGPSGCNTTVATLGPCDAVLTTGGGPTTTSTTVVTTTTRPATTTTATTVVTTTTRGVTTTTATTSPTATPTTSTTAPGSRLDLGLDPSRFLTQYQVQNVLAPVYQVLPTTSGPSPFNDASTPQILPCAIQSLDTQVLVSSAPGGPAVYPQVVLRLYTNAVAPI